MRAWALSLETENWFGLQKVEKQCVWLGTYTRVTSFAISPMKGGEIMNAQAAAELRKQIRHNPRAALRRAGIPEVKLPPQVATSVVTYRP